MQFLLMVNDKKCFLLEAESFQKALFTIQCWWRDADPNRDRCIYVFPNRVEFSWLNQYGDNDELEHPDELEVTVIDLNSLTEPQTLTDFQEPSNPF